MNSALIICNSDPLSDPRPYRMLQYLKSRFRVTVLASRSGEIEGTELLTIPNQKQNLIEKVKLALFYALRLFEKILWTDEIRVIATKLAERDFDLIVCHNLNFLPLALKIKGKGKILLDLREYYPRHFEEQLVWRFIFQPMNIYLCEEYLDKADIHITVSNGIAREYKKQYGIQSNVIESLPSYVDLEPSRVNNDEIRMIHHGNASPSRSIELMIEMMDYIDPRFQLDLMLVGRGNNTYLNKLKEMADHRPNVRIIEPVKMTEIVSFINKYDIGVYLFPPKNFNAKYALPNKLFEFIQARLAVAIGPSIEMADIVEQYNCGIIAKDYKPETLANELNKLNADNLVYYKQKSHIAAKILNSNVNEVNFLDMVGF